MIYAVDPGTSLSALVVLDGDRMVDFALDENWKIRERLKAACGPEHLLAVEWVECYGMPVGQEVFRTLFWIGRFREVWRSAYMEVPRRRVKLELCGVMRAKDKDVRARLLDMYGPGRQKAVGTKQAPGPLYGIKSHGWAALGVAVTARALVTNLFGKA